MRMADEAAALGVERFIIDDGWFKGRNDDWAALGDWYLDEKSTPRPDAGYRSCEIAGDGIRYLGGAGND